MGVVVADSWSLFCVTFRDKLSERIVQNVEGFVNLQNLHFEVASKECKAWILG